MSLDRLSLLILSYLNALIKKLYWKHLLCFTTHMVENDMAIIFICNVFKTIYHILNEGIGT